MAFPSSRVYALVTTVTLLCGIGAASCSSSPAASPAPTAGSDGGPDASTETLPDYRSGTRLRARLLTAEGGSVIFAGWHDKDLDVDCTFGPAEDSKTRCLPDLAYASTEYADAACTMKIVANTAGCAAPKFASSGSSTCSAGPALFRVGAKVSLAIAYAKQADGSCGAGSPTATEDVYAVGDAVAASAFVSATSVQQARGARLAMIYLQADDGAVQALEPYDLARKAACQVTTKGTRCIPTGLSFQEDVFSDGMCLTPAALRPAAGYGCDLPPNVVLRPNPAAMCFTTDALYAEVGAKLAGPIYRKQGTCGPITVADGDSFYEIGTPIPMESFAGVGNKEDGAARVKARSAITETGEHLFARVLFDSERNEECRPAPTADGMSRCIFAGDASSNADSFSDMGCANPVAATYPQGCAPPPFIELATAGAAACASPTVRVFKVGAKITPTMLYKQTSTGCLVVSPAAATDYYDAATEVPASAFAPVQTIVE